MRTQNQNRDIYINKLFAPEDDKLIAIRQLLSSDGKEGINIGAYEGKILQLLLAMIGAKKVVEVGTLYAYSTLWMARALPVGGKIVSLEIQADNHAKAQKLIDQSEVAERIDLRLGPANESLKQLSSEGPFDAVFIDADKAAYPNYLDWAEENVRPGGLIIGDNTFLFGHMYGEPRDQNGTKARIDGMSRFNERLADKTKYLSVILPTDEGMTVALKLQ